MNKQRIKNVKKIARHSPMLFEDEEMGTSSPDEVRRTSVKAATPRTNVYSGHSTPIRNRIKTDASDSPELHYNESPIEPLTQHPPNEVGWDYQRPQTKEDGSSLPSMEISRTPKRSTALLTKKRNSNSPLLHKPLKKKLMQEEQQERLVGLMAELEEIQRKAKQFGEKNVDEQEKLEDAIESQLVIEMDTSDPSGDSDLKLQVSAEESSGQKEKEVEAVHKNSDELLDDSVEEMLVLCSQQVEAEEFGIKNGESIVQPSTNTWRQPQASPACGNSSEKFVKSMPKENLKPLNNNTKVIESTGKNSSSGKGESNSLEIPDDSFDDFMVEFDDDDFCQNGKTDDCIFSDLKPCTNSVSSVGNSKNVVQNKFFQNKSLTCIKQTKIISKPNCYVPDTSNPSIQNKVMNTNASFGYLNQNYIKNANSSGYASQTQASSSGSDKNNETRLFKSKSYSDSNFPNFHKIYNNHSTVTHKPDNKRSSVGSAASSNANVDNNWRRVQSSTHLGTANACNSNSRLSSSKLSNSEGSLPMFTPAEIEAKRREAIMKREAKMRNKVSSAIRSQKIPTQNSIRR